MTTDSIIDAILSGDKTNIQDISTWTGYEPITTSSLLLALCCKLHIGTSSIFASKEEAQLFQDFILSGLSIEDFVTSQDLERDIFDTLIYLFLDQMSRHVLVQNTIQ